MISCEFEISLLLLHFLGIFLSDIRAIMNGSGESESPQKMLFWIFTSATVWSIVVGMVPFFGWSFWMRVIFPFVIHSDMLASCRHLLSFKASLSWIDRHFFITPPEYSSVFFTGLESMHTSKDYYYDYLIFSFTFSFFTIHP